jgi:hypothetical protein
MYYKKWPAREGIVAIVIISSAICLVLGASLGVLIGAICTMASDKSQQAVGRSEIIRWKTFHRGRCPANS